MSDSTTQVPETAEPEVQDSEEIDSGEKSSGADERLSYRGVFARLLVRPEIGAIIAALAIWVFFWSVSDVFGLTPGTAQILDVASTLGIMAVAVALLMIGGEFDLSSGAATGAFGILTLLLVRDFTGDMGGYGLSLWLALPLSLAIALGFGWLNGTLVNRTGLPSFIVTLGSFFIIRGAKLGFSKLIVDQIQVGKMDDLALNAAARGGDKGYGFFQPVFAAEWQRNDHIWDGRDVLYTIGCLVGLGLIALAVFELRFARKESMNPTGLIAFVAGLAGIVAGVLYLHNTDGVSNNAVGGAIIGISMVITGFGLALWRYKPLAERGHVAWQGAWLTELGLGFGALVLAVIAALSLDKNNSETIFLLVTEQGLRAILFVGLGAAGAILMLMAANAAGRNSQSMRSLILLLVAAATAGIAFFIRSQSTANKFRSEVLAVMLVIAALVATWAIVTAVFGERRYPEAAADHLGNRMVLAGLILFAIGVATRILFTTQADLEAGANPAVFSVRTVWFILFAAVCSWVLTRTAFGSWTYAVGGNKEASRQIGVPAARTKTQLFMVVSFAAWLVGTLLAFRLNTIQAGTGNGLEFEYIIAAVVGGTALTGGYGSTFGAAIGAIIMAMSVQGIPASRWNSDWRFVFLGSILLVAVIANNFIRSKAEATR